MTEEIQLSNSIESMKTILGISETAVNSSPVGSVHQSIAIQNVIPSEIPTENAIPSEIPNSLSTTTHVPHKCLRNVTIGDDCEKECAIELIMKLQMHFGIVQQTLETAEDYDANPEWFKKNLGKINRELDHDLTCQCGEQVDIHGQVESIIEKLMEAEKPPRSCSIQ